VHAAPDAAFEGSTVNPSQLRALNDEVEAFLIAAKAQLR
jgi:hypothetical protein